MLAGRLHGGRSCAPAQTSRGSMVDMPQPISNYVSRSDNVQFGYGNVMFHRPKLAAMAMHVIEIWSYIDLRLNEMVAQFLRVDIRIATAMLQAIENISLRRDVIRAAAKHVLDDNDYMLFKATLKSTRTSEGRRHQFAHHIWAISDQFPDDLLLMDPKIVNQREAHTAEALAARSMNIPIEPFDVRGQFDSVYVFKEQDFSDDIARAQSALNHVAKLNLFVRNLKNESSKADVIRRELLAEPLIDSEFRRLSRQKAQ